MKKSYCILSILLLLLSCGKSKDDSIKLINSREIEIKISDTTDSQANKLFYYYDYNSETEYLVNLNYHFNILEFYNIDKSQIDFVLPLNFSVKGILIHNLDSIFCIPRNTNDIVLMNDKGHIYHKYDISTVLNNTDSKYLPFYSINNPLNLINDNLIFSVGLDAYPIEHYKANTMCNYNIKDDKRYTFIKYPKEFSSQDDPGIITKSYCVFNNQLVVIFSDDPHIYLYDLAGNLIKSKDIESKYIDKFPKYDSIRGKQFSYNNKYQITKPEFFNILYDKYNNVFYRLNKHSQNFEDDGVVNDFYDGDWSITILDSNLNFITEQILPAKKYYFLNTYITKKGLIISNNHSLNPNYDEKYFSFSLFELIKGLN